MEPRSINMGDVQVVLPERSEDQTSGGLRRITAAIEKLTDDRGFGLGGESGYGAYWESPVFSMRRFYWGDCDCGFEDRSERWHADHPHADDCFQIELRRRFAAYDLESGIAALEAAIRADDAMEYHTETGPFGEMVSWSKRTAKGEAAHKAWSEAYDNQRKEHRRLTEQLYIERGMDPKAYQWFCTCDTDKLAAAYFEKEGHYPTCALSLPNFRHHATGFEARWYKWIGRDNEYVGECIWPDVLRECLADVAERGRSGIPNATQTASAEDPEPIPPR